MNATVSKKTVTLIIHEHGYECDQCNKKVVVTVTDILQNFLFGY